MSPPNHQSLVNIVDVSFKPHTHTHKTNTQNLPSTIIGFSFSTIIWYWMCKRENKNDDRKTNTLSTFILLQSNRRHWDISNVLQNVYNFCMMTVKWIEKKWIANTFIDQMPFFFLHKYNTISKIKWKYFWYYQKFDANNRLNNNNNKNPNQSSFYLR